MNQAIQMKLNPQQQEAANHIEGPLLILAGAGSGKTRVLTERTANLIEKGVEPNSILAVTFTNKAAKEMAARIQKKLGSTELPVMGTFHSLCCRWLRTCAGAAGYGRNFTIADSADQKKLMKNICDELRIDKESYPPEKILKDISKLKNKGIYQKRYVPSGSPYSLILKPCYDMYQGKLKSYNAMDFDDLLLFMLGILKFKENVRVRLQNSFSQIMVDEYQDTNPVQFELIKILSEKHRNLVVVGDDSQSIYKFRGADFRIILNFKNDYPDAKIIKLEDNYRSTGKIVNIANMIIENNTERFPKTLRAQTDHGTSPVVHYPYSEYDEAEFIGEYIREEVRRGPYTYKDFTLLYRTHMQTRAFEQWFIKNNVPYQIIGGTRFYDRREVKDVLSYLQLILNLNNDIAFERVYNTPKRGIGDSSFNKLKAAAASHKVSLYTAVTENLADLPKKARNALDQFVYILENILSPCADKPVIETIDKVLSATGYGDQLKAEDDKEDTITSRVENIDTLKSAVLEMGPATLQQFMEEVTLLSEADGIKNDNQVKMMTIHASKGLEFPVVFIVGLCETILPHKMSITEGNIEEERRLMYVAVTRAEKELYMTSPQQAYRNGETVYFKPSRFLNEFRV